ncbi:MAG: L,D-transpeptidase family protein [Pseudomonadota bacterium]
MRKLSLKLIAAIALCACASVIANEPALTFELSRSYSEDAPSLLPSEKPSDPILMLVSLRNQSMHVYDGDRLVARSHVSSGKPGHRTPTGIFSILEKRRYHESNIYSQAPMPFMQRLTWSGIALHESDSVPGYPASHGCVRIPGGFAEALFGFTEKGAHVLITDEQVQPQPIMHRTLFYPGGAPTDVDVQQQISSTALRTRVERSGSTSVIRVVELAARNESSEEQHSPVTIAKDIDLRQGIDAVALPDAGDALLEHLSSSEPQQPIRVLITRRTGSQLVRDIQTMLAELGHSSGEADGYMGPETGAAISSFQKSQGLPPTGTASVDIARLLHAETGRGAFPTGHIYVRQGFEPVFDAPFNLADPATPLGTHFFAALPANSKSGQIRWVHASLADSPRPSPLLEIAVEAHSSFVRQASVHAVLDRINLPTHLRERLTAMMVPGSSIAVTDNGLSSESHLGTDFIVLTRP